MVTIRDMIAVKQIERALGRELNEQEMSGEEFIGVFPDGRIERLAVPLVNFPTDLLPAYALISQPDEEQEDGFFTEVETV